MNERSSLILAFSILLYCIWNSFGLVSVWLGAPMELYSWAAFLLWSGPVLVFWVLYVFKKPCCLKWNSFPFWMALLLTVLGQIGTLNTFKYLGLAFAITGFVPWNWRMVLWVAGAVSWMPAFGWLGSHYFPVLLVPLRFAIAGLSAIWALIVIWRKP